MKPFEKVVHKKNGDSHPPRHPDEAQPYLTFGEYYGLQTHCLECALVKAGKVLLFFMKMVNSLSVLAKKFYF